MSRSMTFTLIDKVGYLNPYHWDRFYGTWEVDESYSLTLSIDKEVTKRPIVGKGSTLLKGAYQDSIRYYTPQKNLFTKF